MDYMNLRNVESDTNMRNSIGRMAGPNNTGNKNE